MKESSILCLYFYEYVVVCFILGECSVVLASDTDDHIYKSIS